MQKRQSRKTKQRKPAVPRRDLRLLAGDGTSVRALVTKNLRPRANYTVREVQRLGALSNTAIDSFGTYTFQLSDLSNASAWTAVFDRYRIKAVKVHFNSIGVQMNTTPATYSVPRFATVVDFDDVTTPTSFAQLDRYSTYAGCSGSNNLTRHFLPRAARPVYISAVSTGYQESDPEAWINTDNANVPHYGLKWAMSAGTPVGQACVYEVTIEYEIELAGQRG